MEPELSLRALTPELADMLDAARHHQTIPEEIEAQRRSWIVGELMLDDPALTREQAEAMIREAELEAEAGGLTS